MGTHTKLETELGPANPLCWRPNPQLWWKWGLWVVIKFRWGHESGGVLSGSVPLDTKGLAFSFPLAPAWRFSAVWGYSEKAAVYKPGREPSTGTELASTLISDLPASRGTVRNKFPSFIVFCLEDQANTHACMHTYIGNLMRNSIFTESQSTSRRYLYLLNTRKKKNFLHSWGDWQTPP